MKINSGCGPYVIGLMLAQTRDLRLTDREDIADGLTDVRLHRVFVRNPRNGVSLTPGQ